DVVVEQQSLARLYVVAESHVRLLRNSLRQRIDVGNARFVRRNHTGGLDHFLNFLLADRGKREIRVSLRFRTKFDDVRIFWLLVFGQLGGLVAKHEDKSDNDSQQQYGGDEVAFLHLGRSFPMAASS